jgi:hypothetical protein
MKLLCILVLLVAPAMPAFAVDADKHCYNVHLAAWKPAMRLGGDEIYTTPPQSIALTSDVTRIMSGRKEFAITAALGAKPSVHRLAYWYPDGEKIELVWTNGFSGLSMDLTRTQSGFRGVAHTFWDFDRSAQSSDVSLQEVPCS